MQLDEHIEQIGKLVDANVMTIISPIVPGLDFRVRDAIDQIENKKRRIAIIHDTPGGVVEVVERMVDAIRNAYKEVVFIIPDRAMSAGTIFALSGDRILMDYFSCLGPIDPQIEKDGKLVPALSYLNEFDHLNEQAAQGKLTSAEYALLSKLDLGELYQFKQARELSRELLIKWLSSYKFKNWKKTETNKRTVTREMREGRAREVADMLSSTERWHSHGRGINMRTLTGEIGLKVEYFSDFEGLSAVVKEYFELLKDYMQREQLGYFIHTQGYF